MAANPFANLKVEEAPEGITRTRSTADNQLAPLVAKAAEKKGQAFAFTIPQSDVDTAELLLRSAANKFGVGIAIDYPSRYVDFTNRNGKPGRRREAIADDKGKTRVVYEVRDRRVVNRKSKGADITDAATAERV